MASVPSPAAAAALIRCQYSYGLLRTQHSVKTCPNLGTSRVFALFPGVPAFLRRRSVSAVWQGNRAPPWCGSARTLRLSWRTTSRSLGSGSRSWLFPLRFPHPVTMMAPRLGVESRFLREMEAMGTVLAAMEKAQEEIENEEANEKCLEDIRAAVHAAKAQLDGPTGHLLALLVDAELNALWTRCSQSRGSS